MPPAIACEFTVRFSLSDLCTCRMLSFIHQSYSNEECRQIKKIKFTHKQLIMRIPFSPLVEHVLSLKMFTSGTISMMVVHVSRCKNIICKLHENVCDRCMTT